MADNRTPRFVFESTATIPAVLNLPVTNGAPVNLNLWTNAQLMTFAAFLTTLAEAHEKLFAAPLDLGGKSAAEWVTTIKGIINKRAESINREKLAQINAELEKLKTPEEVKAELLAAKSKLEATLNG